MKKIIFTLGLALAIGSLTAQISEGGIPTTFRTNTIKADYQIIELNKPDMKSILAEDTDASIKGKPYRISVLVPTQLSIHNSGTWETLPNGDKIWRLGIKIDNAQALSLYFSSPVEIPEGGKLHAYNQKHSQYVGAYTASTPSFLSMEMIEGDVITLEYYMPKGSTKLPSINIDNVAYYYRGVEDRIGAFREGATINYAKADACEVDVACSEITGWEEQRDAVVHYVFVSGGNGYVCTGSVVNNTAGDCKPYILTANHCGEPSSSAAIAQHTWYFNYQRPTCQPGVTTPYNGAKSETMSGGTLRASSELGNQSTQSQFQVSGSDFVLVELNSAIPTSYNPYYAGWTRKITPASSGVGIHHPAGHEKKISTFSTSPFSSAYNGGWYGSHWGVTWVATDNGHGVTEGGSSGSPLFNEDGLIVGHLSGGSSYCSDPTASDLYGKFNRAWDAEGSNNNQQLKHWLDPINSGAMSLQGTYAPCQAIYTNVKENTETLIKTYPNPVENTLTVQIGNIKNLTSIELRDITGRLIQSQTPKNTNQIVFDLTNETAGVYFITVISGQGTTTQKIVKL